MSEGGGPKVPRRRLGWLGPAILAVGVAGAAAGIWYIRAAKPVPGAVIDTIPIDGGAKIVVRAEDGGEHSFVELWDGSGELRWSQFIPHYAGRAGRPAVSWGQNVMSVRVERDNRQELWALGLPDGSKGGALFLAPEHEPIPPQLLLEKPEEATLPLSFHDGVRSYELVGGPGWHQIIAIDLRTGKALWKIELGKELVTRVAIVGGQIDLYQGEEWRRINPFNGRWYYPRSDQAKPT